MCITDFNIIIIVLIIFYSKNFKKVLYKSKQLIYNDVTSQVNLVNTLFKKISVNINEREVNRYA